MKTEYLTDLTELGLSWTVYDAKKSVDEFEAYVSRLDQGKIIDFYEGVIRFGFKSLAKKALEHCKDNSDINRIQNAEARVTKRLSFKFLQANLR
ncbi:MAG TPA: hypothetical protein VJB94_00910 [Candidatus Nanoarchaeia archaeon]|nr:hypothetical protein [Candidatus Nanoarchaeia archaeon]